MWLLLDLRRMIFPVPEILNLFTAVLWVFSFDIFVFTCGNRINDDDHFSSAQNGFLVWFAQISYRVYDGLDLSLSNFGVRKFALSEPTDHTHLVPVSKKRPGFSHDDLDVVLTNIGTQLYPFYVLAFGLLVFLELGLLVFVLSVIDNLDDRRVCTLCDQDKVESCIASLIDGFAARHDPQLPSVWADHTDIFEAQQALINVGKRFAPRTAHWHSPYG